MHWIIELETAFRRRSGRNVWKCINSIQTANVYDVEIICGATYMHILYLAHANQTSSIANVVHTITYISLPASCNSALNSVIALDLLKGAVPSNKRSVAQPLFVLYSS